MIYTRNYIYIYKFCYRDVNFTQSCESSITYLVGVDIQNNIFGICPTSNSVKCEETAFLFIILHRSSGSIWVDVEGFTICNCSVLIPQFMQFILNSIFTHLQSENPEITYKNTYKIIYL